MPLPSPRPPLPAVASLLALLLGACTEPGSPQTWNGTSTHNGTTHELRLEVRQAGGLLRGSYYVDAVRGDFHGRVEDSGLTATLTPSGDCTYALAGTITANTITASYAPDECPGGDSGTWELTRP